MQDASGEGSTPGLPTVLAKTEEQAGSADGTTRTKDGLADETTRTKGGLADETVIAEESLDPEETKDTNASGSVTSASEAETGQVMQRTGTATEAGTKVDHEGKTTHD